MRKIVECIAVAVIAMWAMTSCGSSPLEKAVKQALVQQDTTQARFDSICRIVKSNPERYSAYLTPDGQINIDALAQLIDKQGSSLRPPMHWNVAQYGMQQLSLTIYFERSGSMVPYDAPGGGGQLKKAVNDLINYFPSGNVAINIVNDDIYPYGGSVDEFLQDRNIYASTQGVGDASFTDFGKIFNSILAAQHGGNVSVLVTDLIYSPADTRDVSVTKIFNEESSLATRIFKQYKRKSVVVHQLMGDYQGKYYPYNNLPFDYHGQRPFYLLVIADTPVIDAMAASRDYTQFMHPREARNSYRFNQGEASVNYCAVPDWKDNAGRFRVDHHDPAKLTKCEGDKTTGIMCFTIAVDFSTMNKSAQFLADASHYQLHSTSGFKMKVQPIAPSMITGNNRAYLEGKTHLLTLTGKMTEPRDEVTIALANQFPAWIEHSSAVSDVNPAAPDFAGTTLGLKEFLGGIAGAFGTDGNYTTIKMHLER